MQFKRPSSLAIRKNLIRLGVIVAVLLVWQYGSGRIFDPFFFSSPLQIYASLIGLWSGKGYASGGVTLLHHAGITLYEAVSGFLIGALLGIITGMVLGLSRQLGDALDPLIYMLYSVPKIVLIPLFILWFGLGISSKIAYAAVSTYFLVFINTTAGLREVDRELLDSIKVIGATERQLLTKIKLPAAETFIFTGLRVSVPLAIVGAVVAEYLTANAGLGYVIAYASSTFDTATAFAGLFVLLILTILVDWALKLSENYVFPWKRTKPVQTT